MEATKITLKTGTVIQDNRSLGLGLKIIHRDGIRFVSLGYNSSSKSFHASPSGCHVGKEDVKHYIAELNAVHSEIVEASNLIKL